MKFFHLFLAITSVISSPVGDWAGKLIPNQYIIVFKPNALVSEIESHWRWLETVLAPVLPASSFFSVQEDARTDQYMETSSSEFWDVFGIMHKYNFHDFKGYSARLPEFIVKLLERHSLVSIIEQDQIFTIDDHEVGKQTKVQAWGLTRISNRDLPPSSEKSYSYPASAGTGVTAYVIDTGVFVAHPEFEGRARIGKSFSGDGTRDGNGHGTHVAGTIGSKTFGVAKNVSIVAVKVLDNQGSGTTSNVIAGIDWAAKDSAKNNKNGKKKSVANMSLGGGASVALDKAVKAATQAGLVFAVAAGNSGRDACLLSPARVPEAITVAASDKFDKLAYFSERGKCVDIIAPGVDILSTWNNGKTNVISGTSMATPHVCGVVALALAEGEFNTVKEVHDYLKAVSSKDKIEGSLKGAPNSLLYNMVFEGGFPDDEPKEPKEPSPEDPDEPDEPNEGECPIPQCLFDPRVLSITSNGVILVASQDLDPTFVLPSKPFLKCALQDAPFSAQKLLVMIDIDPSKLHPLSPEVISKQATINVGTIGHVAHGKSTVVKSISGVQTVRFKNEIERNITIKLGYANAKIFKCDEESCPRPGCYRSYKSDKDEGFPCERVGCMGRYRLIRHVSFVDCPGHDILMATMLNGAAVMDAALLLIAANETCPQPQTQEHLAAIEIMKLKHIIILQNKIDLIKESAAESHYQSILAFIQGTVADNAPVIPISAQLKYNIDAVNEYIVKKVPIPIRDFSAAPRMIVIRSFDVNKPGTEIANLKGGVAGGSILCGVLKVGDEIEVRPGVVSKDSEGRTKCRTIFSKIISLYAEHNDLKFAVPGGLIGVGTKIDPTICRSDRLVGQILGAVGTLPEIYVELEINYFLLRRLLGVKTEDKKQTKVQKLAKNEVLMLNIGSTSTGGRVLSVKADLAKIVLTTPACTEVGEKIALSRRIDTHWRLIGWGKIKRGLSLDPE